MTTSMEPRYAVFNAKVQEFLAVQFRSIDEAGAFVSEHLDLSLPNEVVLYNSLRFHRLREQTHHYHKRMQ